MFKDLIPNDSLVLALGDKYISNKKTSKYDIGLQLGLLTLIETDYVYSKFKCACGDIRCIKTDTIATTISVSCGCTSALNPSNVKALNIHRLYKTFNANQSEENTGLWKGQAFELIKWYLNTYPNRRIISIYRVDKALPWTNENVFINDVTV